MNRDRMLTSLATKVAQSVGHRADLQLADVRKIAANTAHFMISYLEDKVPSTEDIGEFFLKKYSGKITPHMATAKVYKTQKAVTIVAQLLNLTRDIEDIKRRNLKPVIAGLTYLDVPLQDLYQVVERNGQKVLLKKQKEDIIAIVEARRSSMLDQSSSRKTFASLVEASNMANLIMLIEKGDVVKAMVEDKYVECEVMAVSDTEVKLKCSGNAVSVPRQAVIEIVRKNQASIDKSKSSQEEYFSKAYGSPEYAKQLVK
jgi:hypothetical protein